MADDQLLHMADVIAATHAHLTGTALQLPIPIILPRLEETAQGNDIADPLERLRTLILDEPLPPAAIGHLDQAILSVLTAMDLLRTATETEIRWRFDAVFALCAGARADLHIFKEYLR